MTNSIPRRDFIRRSAAAGSILGATLSSSMIRAAEEPHNKVVVGIMGLSRGRALAQSFMLEPGVEVKYLCDVDANRLAAAAKSLEQFSENTPETTGDFRKILEDKDVDALVCAAPNHWHAPAAILACVHGKHCYVEKPCCQNPAEGELLVQASRKYKKAVQMGNQRRSSPAIIEAIGKIREGIIGRPYFSRSWYANARGTIGTGKPADVPGHLNYDLWQGPAPRTEYMDNRVHYNWHWFWQWGNGELGNNGIHSIDISRWALGVDFPIRATSSGGRYRFDDDQQTPDTHAIAFEFENDCQIVWEGLSCNRHGIDGSGYGVSVHGENGTIVFGSGGYKLFDDRDKVIEEVNGERGDTEHISNFVAAIRADSHAGLNSEIAEGHKSTLLCHLGNIAQRTGRALTCDPANGHILDDADAMTYWQRDYEPGWEPTI